MIWGCKKDFRVFPRYEEQGPLNKWPWKYQVKVITQGHIVGPTSHRLTPLPFHANRPSYSWDTAFSKSDLGNSSFKAAERSVPHFLSIHPPLCQSVFLFMWYGFFNIWPWKSKVNATSSSCCTTVGFDNSLELWTAQIHPAVSKTCVIIIFQTTKNIFVNNFELFCMCDYMESWSPS